MALEGMGTELGVISVGFIIIKYVIHPLIMRIPVVQQRMDGRKRNRNNGESTQKIKLANPYPPPGQGGECIKHGKLLTEIDTKLEMFMENCKEDFERLRGNIKDLYDKYDSVKKR